MLPDILASSYKRYKEDTDVFATWLSRTAEACGYNLPRPPQPSIQVLPVASTRLKGKARKEAKKSSAGSVSVGPALHRSVTTRDMIIQATFIAKKPNVILPIKVQRVLQRAISARRRCLNWFRGVKPQADSVETETDSNATHEHFIQVLEELLEILEPCYVTAKPAPKVVDEDPAINLSNRFGMLSVEDTSNSDLDVTVTDQDLVVLPKPSSKAQPTVYEVETNPDMDIPFVVYCFFEDMHRIQEFLKDTWRRYVAKELDLVTASITTNLAFALVRQAEQNVVDTYPKRFGSQNEDESQYEKIASVIRYIYQVSYEGGAPSKGEVASAPFDDFVYMSTYHVLSKFLMLRKSEEQRGPITEVAPLGALYFWQDDLQQPTSENWEGEDERLTQLLLDLSFRKEYAPPGSQGDAIFTHFDPADDELTKGLDELIYSGDHAAISVWIVFAANCLIDIWRMTDTKPAYDRLLEKAATLKESLKVKSQESVEVTSQGSLVKGPAAENMIDLWRTISNVVEYNTKIHLKAEWLDKAKLQYGEGWLNQEAPTAEAAASILYPGMQAILEWDMATLERRKQKDARAIKSATHQVELESDSEDDGDLSANDALTLVENPDKRSSSKIIKQRKSSKKKDVEKDLAPWDQDPDTTFLLHKENGYQPPTLEDIAEIVRNKGLKLKNIRPSPDAAFFYRNNPMYCGNESLRLTIGMAYAGVNLANSYASLFAVSQLYNAVQQNHGEIIGGRWHALDEAIEANIDDLFSGQLPTTYYECWTRAVIRLGVPATAFAKNRRDARQSSQQMVTVKGKYHLKHNQTSTILDGYLKGQESAERCLIQIGELYQTDRRAEAIRTGQQSLVRKHEKRFVTPLEALGKLREHVAESLPAMERNYVRLTKQCDTLLARIRKRRRNSILSEDDQMGLNSKVKGVTAADLQIAENKSMVFNILQEAYAASEQKKQPEKYQGLQTPNHLLMVAKEIRDFLPEANKELEVEKWKGVKGQWGNPSMSDEAAALQLFLLPFAEQRMQISGLDVPQPRIAGEEAPRNQAEHFEEMAEAWDFKGAIEEFNRLRSL